MVDRPKPIPLKNEHFPLLKVNGGGDAIKRPVTSFSSLWNASSCTFRPIRPWSERWPEYLSTCWMTFVLLGVSFLVFYAFGMVIIYRHEGYLFFKCNDSKYTSDVYYHHVIPRGTPFPLATYSDYLTNIATRYRTLRINVFFMIDDTVHSPNGLYNKVHRYAYNPSRYVEEYNLNNKREVRDLQRKYQNINITVVFLSKYMSLTPMKYKWKNIPVPYIPFYARVFTTWIGGGVGLDLALYNEHYKRGHERHNLIIDTILKQHSTEIKPYKYIEALENIEHQEETEFITSFMKMVQKMFNDTMLIFNNTWPDIFSNERSITGDVPLVRIQRNKRDISEKKIDNNTSDSNTTAQAIIVSIVTDNSTALNGSGDSDKRDVYHIYPGKIPEEATRARTETNTTRSSNTTTESPKSTANGSVVIPDYGKEMELNKTEWPQIVFFYDFSVVSDPMRSNVKENDARIPLYERVMNTRVIAPTMNFIAVESEGSYIATPSAFHPFLAAVMANGCRRMHPKFAIQNALLTQCSGIFRDEQYCDHIYVL